MVSGTARRNGAKNTPYMIEQDGYTLVDVMLGFKPTEHIDARVNLNNAFNKKYYNALSNSVAVPSNVMVSHAT